MPGFAFGAPLGSYYQLYYFFPLSDEQQNLALVQRIMLLVGLALVVLLAGDRLAGHPVGRGAGPAGRQRRAAASRGQPP